MAKCFLCGAASAGPTCHACLKGGTGKSAGAPKRTLADLFGQGVKKPSGNTTQTVPHTSAPAAQAPAPSDTQTTDVSPPKPPVTDGDNRTGFEAKTAEVPGPKRQDPVIAPPAASAPGPGDGADADAPAVRREPKTDEIPLELVSLPQTPAAPAPPKPRPVPASGAHPSFAAAFAAIEAPEHAKAEVISGPVDRAAHAAAAHASPAVQPVARPGGPEASASAAASVSPTPGRPVTPAAQAPRAKPAPGSPLGGQGAQTATQSTPIPPGVLAGARAGAAMESLQTAEFEDVDVEAVSIEPRQGPISTPVVEMIPAQPAAALPPVPPPAAPAPLEFAAPAQGTPPSQGAASDFDPGEAVNGDPPKGLKKIERWNSILDESPVFAGQGHFEVQTPCAPAPGTLDVALGVRFDVPSAPADTDPVVHMMVTISPYGAPLMLGHDGPVAHIVIALDLSASMNDPVKYPLLTRALSTMFRELRSKWAHEVLVSVIAFAYGSETLIHAVRSSEIDERLILDKLDSWDKRFTRYTDLVGALHRAGRIARDSIAANKAMPVRIYVLTDGKPQDMKGAREVTALIAKLPVDVNGLAFGEDADVDSLSELFAGGRGGTVKHIRSDTIREAFGRVGEVAQLVVANRALLDVELRGGVIGGEAFRYRPARYRFPQGTFERGTRFSTDLGTLESGRTYSLIFQLRLRRAKSAETEIGRIALRVPGFGGARMFEKVVAIRRHPGTDCVEADPEVQAALDVVAALDSDDPEATLRALKIRRAIYAQERRDPHVLFVIDKAIIELEKHGNLAGLTPSEHATLVSHTLTTRTGRTDEAAAARRRAGQAAGDPGTGEIERPAVAPGAERGMA